MNLYCDPIAGDTSNNIKLVDKMKLVVKNGAGETATILIKSNETFTDLKERVEEEAGISLDLKDIALKGRKITETQRVMEYFLSYTEPEEEPPVNVFCAVPGCNNTKFTHPEKVFFEFPSEEIRCHQWVLYCQKLNNGPGRKRLSLSSESTICSDHFRQDQFVKNTNTLLKRTAVPCVKSEPESSLTENGFEDFDSAKFSEYFFDEEDIGIDLTPGPLCRLCASNSGDFIMIYDEVGRKLKLAEKINLCLPIEVSINDGLPKQICRLCLNELNEMFDLADTVSLAQNKFIDMADDEIAYRNDDLTLLSMDETGEEVVLGSSSPPKYDEEPIQPQTCPLCIDGTMNVEDPIMNVKCEVKLTEEAGEPSDEDEVPTSIFCAALNEIDSFDLNPGDPKSNCFDKSDVFTESDYSDSLVTKKCVDPLESVKSYDSFYCKYDTSDLDSQLGSSPPRDFKETDPLKLDDSSRSDNEHISDSYSYPSPLAIMNSEDSSLKHMRDNPLSPINEELQMDSEFYAVDTAESENSNVPSLNEYPSTKHYLPQNTDPVDCRICGFDFPGYDELERHSLLHSYPGFYQCSACVKFFFTRAELNRHYDKHKFPESDIFYCDYCNSTFTSAFTMAAHLCKIEEPSGGIRCPICLKCYRTKARLEHHMKFHDGSLKAHCTVCDKTFSDDSKLQKHAMFVHNARRSHCCEECGKVFKSEASMRYHQRAHQIEEGVRPYTCERCGKTFIRKSMLINHLASSHRHTSFETSCFNCKLCFEAFPTTGAAVSHMDNNHKLECMDEHTYSFEMLTISRLFVCEYCERCFAESTLLNSHRSRHNTDDAPFECTVCDSSFSSLDAFRSHRKSHTGDEIPPEYLAEFTIPKTYLCEFCDRCFLNQTKYNEHLTVHFGAEPYQCRQCTVRFSSLAEAMDHRSNHGDVQPTDDYNFYRPYECHYCNKTFAIEDALVKHIRMHTGEKPFICDQCGKGFSQSSGLYTHQKVHSSERPYSCSVCPRTFKIKGDRDVHVRKHSGDRPYKCEFCGKAFMTQHVYSQHRKIHTGERPYKCDVCGIAFRRSHVLTVHKRIHTGEKPNICDVCGKRYRQKGDMLKHKRVQHGIMNTKPILDPFSF